MEPTTTPMLQMPVVESRPTVRTLRLIRDLLHAFHSNGIRYCHWKSNEHLAASMTGDTDLDVLFDASERERLEAVLQQTGFKKFHPVPQKKYRDIEDYIGLDTQSGKLVHLHAHFRLTLGEPYLKSYQLPLEEKVLLSATFDAEHQIFCIQPEWELVLLYIREALKIRNRNLPGIFMGNKVSFSKNILREYQWLRQRCSDMVVRKLLAGMFSDPLPVYSFLIRRFDRQQILPLSAMLRREFRQYRMYPAWKCMLLRWYREVAIKSNRKLQQLLGAPVLSRRVHPGGGMVIAVIGADGSGKSTVIADLEKTFRNKLDVFRLYLGRGDGRISPLRRLLHGVKNILVPAKAKKTNTGNATSKRQGWWISCYKCIEALMVAGEKQRNLQRMLAARAKGMLVICDRFPQNQVMGYNDGPLLQAFLHSRNFLFRAAARREAACYRFAAAHTPDVVVKLIADARVVAARKPGETSLQMLEAKIAGIRSLTFKGSRERVIDAAQPLQQVLYEVKQALWHHWH